MIAGLYQRANPDTDRPGSMPCSATRSQAGPGADLPRACEGTQPHPHPEAGLQDRGARTLGCAKPPGLWDFAMEALENDTEVVIKSHVGFD